MAAGENEYTRFGCRELIANRAVDILQADSVTTGGITEWRKIAAMAAAYHIPMAPHGNPHMSVHLMGSIPNGLIMETYPSISGHMAELVSIPEVEEGYITIPNRPGLGLGLKQDAVKKYRVD